MPSLAYLFTMLLPWWYYGVILLVLVGLALVLRKTRL